MARLDDPMMAWAWASEKRQGPHTNTCHSGRVPHLIRNRGALKFNCHDAFLVDGGLAVY